MNRRKFLGVGGVTILTAGGAGYLISDKNNVVRTDVKAISSNKSPLAPDERKINPVSLRRPVDWFVRT